ncbi:SRPBCC family protein [Nocardioides sp. KC13]|uniref:SRPBCC family protein n=1 Tax=Nocardioides turkmenicus TaxID=2711220 RepID=A0A6M1R105_9ACTN|nr:SRPBCC family protein [Nocardioides sp. KC13]NGN93924.1 SRPBCC family protein [Nocardioides sp. KC13]
MSRNHRLVHASPEHVWDVLSDGWLYPLWVVGASRLRDADKDWPNVGSQLYHSVGVWPLLLDDSTEVLECTPGRRLLLRARGWPVGAAHVEITVEPAGEDTEIAIREQAVAGPGALIPRLVQDPILKWRNVEALRRLAYIVERRP